MAQARYNGVNGLSRRVKLLAMSNWYDAEDLLRNVIEMKGANYNIQAVRDSMLEKVNNSRLERAPFGQAMRFPAGRDYVCENIGQWSGIFKQLRMSLSHKDKANVFIRGETNPNTGGNNGNNKPAGDQQDTSDSFTAIHNALETIANKLTKAEDLIDQHYFEVKMGQRWQTRAAPDAQWVTVEPAVQWGDETIDPPAPPAQ